MYPQLAYYYEHRDYKLQYQKEYYKKNKEWITKYYKFYYEKNKTNKCKKSINKKILNKNSYNNKKDDVRSHKIEERNISLVVSFD